MELIGAPKFLRAEIDNDPEKIKYEDAISKYKKLEKSLIDISENLRNPDIIKIINDLTILLIDKNNLIVNNKIVGQYDKYIQTALTEKIKNVNNFIIKSIPIRFT